MKIAFELPAEAEVALREEGKEMSVAAREAVLVELYRRNRLTHFQLARALEVSRMETDGVLKRHGVVEDLMTVEEFRQEAEEGATRIAGESTRPIFSLQFSITEIESLANRYRYKTDVKPIETLVPKVRACGHLTKDDLIAIGKWKAPRAAHHIKKNDPERVVEATRFALSTPDEQMRIDTLAQLHGVGYPMASVVLHWYHTDPYPILDFRALWSVGVKFPPAQYSFEFWISYVAYWRQLKSNAGVDKRTLDKALWQYSKENQPPRISAKKK